MPGGVRLITPRWCPPASRAVRRSSWPDLHTGFGTATQLLSGISSQPDELRQPGLQGQKEWRHTEDPEHVHHAGRRVVDAREVHVRSGRYEELHGLPHERIVAAQAVRPGSELARER